MAVDILVNIASCNALTLFQHQATDWTNADLKSIAPKGKNLSEILIKIQTFSLKKIH